MKVIKKKLSELKPAEKNARVHNERQIEEFKKSIQKFGQIRPMTIDENGMILTGNGLYIALCEMGFEYGDCYIIPNLSGDDKKRLILADNRVFELGSTDDDILREILSELNTDEEIPGFSDDEIEAILEGIEDCVDDVFEESDQGNDKCGFDNPRPETEVVSSADDSPEEKPIEGNFNESSFRYKPQYGVTVILDSEAEQEETYNKLSSMGYNCRVVTV